MAKLRDVADRAGVGVGTASRAFSGRGYVDASTRDRVLAAAEELGYRPNAVARALREQKTRVVGLLLPDIVNEFYTESAATLQSALAQSRFQLLVGISGNDSELETVALQAMLDHRVDGIIHVPVDPARTLPTSVPIIQLNRHSVPLQTDCVISDDRYGIEQLTRWVLEQGHTDIALITGASVHSTSIDRLEGFRTAVDHAGLKEDGDPENRFRILAQSFSTDWGREAVKSLHDDLPTAIIAASSRIALGVVHGCTQLAIDIPGDISLAAHGRPEWYEALHPAISAYAPPLGEMGLAAAAAILSKITEADSDDDNGTNAHPQPQVTRMRGDLHARQSIGPPRKA